MDFKTKPIYSATTRTRPLGRKLINHTFFYKQRILVLLVNGPIRFKSLNNTSATKFETTVNLRTSQETCSFSDWSVGLFTFHSNECIYLQNFLAFDDTSYVFGDVLFAKHST